MFVEILAKNLKIMEYLFEDRREIDKIITKVRVQSLVTESPGSSSRAVEIGERRQSLAESSLLNYVFRTYCEPE